MKSSAEIKLELSQFSGTSQYFQHPFGQLLYTDGVQYLAQECNAYWLLDVICSYRLVKKIREEDFLVHKLKVNLGTRTAVYSIEDGNNHVLTVQNIEFTDFPLSEISIFQSANVMYLPSEH